MFTPLTLNRKLGDTELTLQDGYGGGVALSDLRRDFGFTNSYCQYKGSGLAQQQSTPSVPFGRIPGAGAPWNNQGESVSYPDTTGENVAPQSKVS